MSPDYFAFHSYFSFRYGILSPEEIVQTVLKAGGKKAVLCDINFSGAIYDFVKLCERENIQPIAGIDFRNDKDIPLYTGIARDSEGFEQLNRFLSEHLTAWKPFPAIAPCLPSTLFIYPSHHLPHETELPKDHYAGIQTPDFNRLKLSRFPKEKILYFPVYTGAEDSHRRLHRILRAIDKNTLLSNLTGKKNNGGFSVFSGNHVIKPELQPYCTNTSALLDDCNIRFDSYPKNKKYFTVDKNQDENLLERLAREGLEKRYGRSPDYEEAKKRLEKELKTIKSLNFTSYFLITWDIIRYARENNITHVGRGSGANSIVAYCLGITNVDPVELDLYFERFINPLRSAPPDFDIDFSWKERERIQHYIFEKYGNEKVALLGTIVRFTLRSLYREVGKVFGLPKDEIDFFTRFPEKAKDKDSIHTEIYLTAQRLSGFPNYNSVHAGGILITEKSIFRYTALHFPPKSLPATQFDMFTAEAMGFEKLDILSQRGIGHIRECVEMIKEKHGTAVDIDDIETIKQDKKVKTLLRKGETIGAFYIESPAMQGLLKKLRCEDYLTLVAASSIIRPGVAKSGMMKTYIENYHHPGKIRYLHPLLKELLAETFGVMVYQEDVLKVGMRFAGLEAADADLLRRAMSGKYRSREGFEKIKQKFFNNCRQRGYSPSITEEVWRQMESFAGYSFSKAHSASYAVESYQSLYLKAHYPGEFMVSVINNGGGFYPAWLYFHEAKRLGMTVEPPCINRSQYLTHIEGNTIYTGFSHVLNLNAAWIKSVIKEREENGPFRSMEDFIRRTKKQKESTIALIQLDAFRFSGQKPPELLWQYFHFSGSHKQPDSLLFSQVTEALNIPALHHDPIEQGFKEMELLGFPVSIDYFDMLKTRFRGEIFARDMLSHTGKTVRMVGRLVTVKYIKTKRKEYMAFGYFIDYQGNYFDTVHFPVSLKEYPFQGQGIYLLKGKISVEYGHGSMEVSQMAKLPLRERYSNGQM